MMESNTSSMYSLEAVYDVLRDRRRRHVLYHLRDAPDGVSDFEAVEERILELETTGIGETDEDRREGDVAAMLHHLHLPKLAEYGIIDYDWRTRTIRYHPDGLLEAHLNLAEQHDFP